MRTIKTVKMTSEQTRRYNLMREDSLCAEVAYYAAGEHYAKVVKKFWEELHEIFNLPQNSKPAVNWGNNEITFLDKE